MPATPPLGRAYRRFWWGTASSQLGEGIAQTAFPLLAVTLTRSPALVAGVSLVTNLPWLLTAMHAGALADRHDRRRLMVLANLLRGAGMVVLVGVVVLGGPPLVVLYCVAFVVGTAQTVFDTASQSIVPQLVPPSRLSAANGRVQAAQLTVREFAGPPVAGLLVAISFSITFGIAGMAYLFGAGVLTGLRGRRCTQGSPPTGLNRAAMEGLQYTLQHPVLRPLALLGAAANGLFAAWMAVFVLHAVEPGPMGLSELAYGLLFTASAAGSVAGTFLAERLERRVGTRMLMLVSLLGWAVFLGAPALSTSGWVVGAAFMLGSIGGVMWPIIGIGIRQRIAPDELLGRVNAGHRLFAWGALPIGAGVGGLLGEVMPLPTLFAATAIATLLLSIPVWTTMRDDRLA